MIRNKVVILGFRFILGGVFIWAGILKIIDPLGFARDIDNYRFFPHALSFFLALLLPWLEVICGACVVIGIYRRAGAFLLSFLILGFLGLIFLTMIRGINVDCGCFGSLSRKADITLFLTDTALCFFAINIWAYPPKQQAL
ncbi:MAG: DoxX family membrane protein [Candidatus Aminicenantes bacterium]|nr:DoxX family membrane protein [Candidatus Aminicenantes bacterium]